MIAVWLLCTSLVCIDIWMWTTLHFVIVGSVCSTTDCYFLWVNMTEKTLSVEWQEEGVMVYRPLPAAQGSFPCVSTSPLPESWGHNHCLDQNKDTQYSLYPTEPLLLHLAFTNQMFIASNRIFVIEHDTLSAVESRHRSWQQMWRQLPVSQICAFPL